MPKRSSSDLNQTAFNVVQQSTGQSVPAVQTSGQVPAVQVHASGQVKKPAAIALGRLGGLRGGKARAASLSSAERKPVAINAAKKRWENHKVKQQSSGIIKNAEK